MSTKPKVPPLSAAQQEKVIEQLLPGMIEVAKLYIEVGRGLRVTSRADSGELARPI